MQRVHGERRRGARAEARRIGFLVLAATTAGATLLGTGACDDERKAPAGVDAAAAQTASARAASGSAVAVATDAGATPSTAPVSTWDGSMPERPVPRAHPTVGSGMPAEVQMKAIAYMSSMSQPRYDDAYIDPPYVKALVEQLKPIALSMDKGSGADKAKTNTVTSIAGGRRIDIVLASGCDAELPTRAVQGRASASFPTLLSHGVLVIACRDGRGECLQSTRDSGDILCTRHK